MGPRICPQKYVGILQFQDYVRRRRLIHVSQNIYTLITYYWKETYPTGRSSEKKYKGYPPDIYMQLRKSSIPSKETWMTTQNLSHWPVADFPKVSPSSARLCRISLSKEVKRNYNFIFQSKNKRIRSSSNKLSLLSLSIAKRRKRSTRDSIDHERNEFAETVYDR